MWKYCVMLCLSLGLLHACKDESAQHSAQTALRPVRTLLVTESNTAPVQEFPGVVDVAQKAELSFRVAGKLTELRAKESERVQKGQVLAQLDKTDFTITYMNRQAEYDKAQSDLARAEKLLPQGHISQTDYDKLKAQYATAKANLSAAEQNLQYTTLTAPFAGQIARRHVENYEEVNAKQVIYSLQDLKSLTVKINVPETIMIRVKRNPQRKGVAIFDAIPDKQFPLHLKEVATQADAEAKTFEVTLDLEGTQGFNIFPGMSTLVRVQNLFDKDYRISTVIPAHAVLEDAQGRYVFVAVAGKDKVGKVVRRKVSTGNLSDAGLEITAGLTHGDHVVIAGMSKLHDGMPVLFQSESTP